MTAYRQRYNKSGVTLKFGKTESSSGGKGRSREEEKLHAECFQFMWNNYREERLSFWHTNQNSSNIIKGNHMKALGVVPGIWDFQWITPSGSTVYIEFKSLTGSLSKDQANFQTKVSERNRNSFWYVVKHKQEFEDIIKRHI